MCNCYMKANGCPITCNCSCHHVTGASPVVKASSFAHLLQGIATSEKLIFTKMEDSNCPICTQSIYNIMCAESMNHSPRFAGITFVKHIRNETALGLKEAKEFVDLLILEKLIGLGIQAQTTDYRQARAKILENQIRDLQIQLAKLKG